MKNVVLKSLFLFISIPLINSIAFGVGTLFHEMAQTEITAEQFSAYKLSMILLISFVGISIVLIETLHEFRFRNNRTTSLLYLGAFSLMAVLTLDQFSFRPFEHSLTFLSIVTVVFTRLLFGATKLLPALSPRVSENS